MKRCDLLQDCIEEIVTSLSGDRAARMQSSTLKLSELRHSKINEHYNGRQNKARAHCQLPV